MIEGKRVFLKKIEEKNLSKILNWINNYEISYFIGNEWPVSYEENKIWYQKLLNDTTKRIFGIYFKENNEYIGNISIRDINLRYRNAQLTIFIGEDKFRKKGLAQDSVLTLLKYCFEYLNLHRIYVFIHENNIDSINLFQKCGFIKEGLMREHEYHNGKYINKVIMGILKSEFKE